MASDTRLQPSFTDDAERARALDPTQSFIVQAPAGSGKTELLMQRYLALLAHESVTQPESVLAITFTKKAAAEMRNRVLEALHDATGPEPDKPHKRVSWELARSVAKRDRELGWNILGNPARLEIRTVDSFCEKIANRTPLLAGLGQPGTIAADFEPLYREAARRTLIMMGDPNAENASAVACVVRDQDNQLGRVENLLVEMLQRRDQWLRLIGGSLQWSDDEKLEIRKQLERALQDAISAELVTIRAQIERAVPADVIHAIFTHARFGATTEEAWHSMQHLDRINDLPGVNSADLPKWLALRCFCMTKDKLRKQASLEQGFRGGGEHKRQKQDFKDLFESIAAAPYGDTLCSALSRLDDLPPCQYEDQQWESLLALFRVLLLSVANLRSVFAERGEVDHTEVALAAKAALGDEGHPTDLALHLGYKIQHLLVDEFQDTSVSQTELLERLIQTWSPESGATLFVVGDPMQSIYGFRQAEVTLFQRARTSGFGASMWHLEPISLSTNFRSRPELVSWFNGTFPQILTEDSEVTGAVKYAPCDAARANSSDSRVICEAASPKNLAEEADCVAELVQHELERQAESIAILVRSRRHLIHIAPALREAGIRFRAKDIDVLNERQTVRDLHSLTRAMLHLGDRTAWLSLLRAPWCGLSVADLLELCRGERHKAVWSLLQLRSASLRSHAQTVLQRVRPILEEALNQRGRIPLRELIGGLWFSLGGPATCSGNDRQDKLRDAETYLSLLEALEADGAIDEDRLESEIASLFAQPDTSPDIRVEIMTIHGAKGLEFDTVILPGLNRRTDQNRTQLLNWREQVIENHRDLLLAPMDPVASKYEQTPIAKYITMLTNECSAEESKRLFYVAATRARERLYLVATVPEEDKNPEKGSMFSLLPDTIRAEFERGAEEVAEPIPPAPLDLRRLPSYWIHPPAPEPLVFESRYPAVAHDAEPRHTFIRVGENLRRVGTVTHRLLQQIGEEGAEAWTETRVERSSTVVRALLVQQGIREADLAGAERRVKDALRKTLGDEHGRWILRHRPESVNEFALSSVLDGGRRSIKVDRTFVEDEVRWLIDYKTSDREGTITESYLQEQIEKYREDLERYARVLHAFDGRTVRGGLYFPLLQRWCEVKFFS